MTRAGDKPILRECVVQSILGYFDNSLEELRDSYEDNGFIINYLNKLDKCFV